MKTESTKLHEHFQIGNLCWYCGGELVWQNDFDLFDIYPEMEGYYEGGIVTYLTCSQCGADVEYKLTEEVKENEGEKNE